MTLIEVVCGVLVHEGRLLITQRLPDADLPNLWEFPGGKIHPEEAPETALHREILEELGVRVHIVRHLTTLEHQYPEKKNTIHRLHFYLCRLRDGRPQAMQANDLRWVAPQELSGYAFPAADCEVIESLPQWLSSEENPCL